MSDSHSLEKETTFTPLIGRGDSYYVYTGEEGHAISVAANGIGPNGGWVGINIATMAMPGPNKTREQIDAAAKLFASAPELYEALIAASARIEELRDPSVNGTWNDALKRRIDAVMLKARGEDRSHEGK